MQQEPTKSELDNILNHFNNSKIKYLNKKSTKTPLIRKIYVNANQISNKIIYREPSITSNDYKQTMNNYRLYVDSYNKSVKLENELIAEYNNNVAEFQKKNNLHILDFQFVAEFQKKYNRLFVREYNELVAVNNLNKNKLILVKKKIPTIKHTTERFFEVLLYFYSSQIRSKTRLLNSINQPQSRVLGKMILNYTSVKNHKKNGVKRLGDVSKKTIQNHVKRLREAKILTNYHFTNQNKPVSLEFNKKILVISDLKPYISQNAQNQLFITEPSKNLHHYIDSTINNNKINIKKREKEFFNACLADGLQNYNSECSTKISNSKTLIEKRKKISQKKEKVQLQSHYQFAEKLSKHQPTQPIIKNKDLEKESNFGLMSRKAYTQLLVQQIVLFAYYKLYQQHKHIKIYSGNIQNTLKMLENRFYINNSWYLKKEVMYKTFVEYIAAIKNSNKYIKNKEFDKILNPLDYFDSSRKHQTDGGLEYHLIKIRKHKKETKTNKKTTKQIKQKQKNNAEKRKATRYNSMFDRAVKKYENGKYQSINSLVTYCENNLPKKYLKKLIFYINSL